MKISVASGYQAYLSHKTHFVSAKISASVV